MEVILTEEEKHIAEIQSCARTEIILSILEKKTAFKNRVKYPGDPNDISMKECDRLICLIKKGS